MNSKRIGFDRKLQLDWLDTTVGLCQGSLDPGTIAERLQQHLVNEVGGAVARRKTINILSRIWVNVPQEHRSLRDEALELAVQIKPEERLWLHWGMSLLAYPLFRDVAATVGQLSHLQGVFSQAQIQRRMIESWGQRTTLQRAVRRILRTFVAWDVLRDTDVRGSYDIAPPRQTDNQSLALWFLDCALRTNEAEQVLLRELEQLSYIFPFNLLSFISDVRRSGRFEVTRQGLDLEMVGSGVS
ncbi:MAG: hypothetical protein PVF45_05400 [Anaerolineae bacterium]|jgi:hypothetical protein